MLPKAKRLTARDFIGRPKIAYRGAFFDVSTLPGESLKFACIVAKKRIKRAVDRNRARRKVYALLESVSTHPMYVFVYPTSAILEAPHTTLKQEITKAFATL